MAIAVVKKLRPSGLAVSALALFAGGWALSPHFFSILFFVAGGVLLGLLLAGRPRVMKPEAIPSPLQSAATEENPVNRLDAVTQALQEGVLELYTLIELSRMISASLDLEQLLTTTIKTVVEKTQVEAYCLFLYDEESRRLVVRTSGGAGTEVLKELKLAPGEGLAGRVFERRTPELFPVISEPAWPDLPPGVSSALAAPLAIKDGSVGVITLMSRRSGAFTERDLIFFSAVANQLGIAVENARLYHRTKELSYRDSLTGLFNRRYFEETLAQEIRRAERYKMPLTLIMVDIDHFKRYNDTHGHPKGDEVLKDVSTILLKNTRQVDVVARYGGEELVLILPLTPKEPALLVAEKLRRAIEEAPVPGEQILPERRLTISLGVATYPSDATTAAGLVLAADRALYQAKQGGRNRVAGAVTSPATV
jgi:diguanylate cyclase (GGDEF)-like protein